MKEMAQLSGGQKSLVALALIFAILPFTFPPYGGTMAVLGVMGLLVFFKPGSSKTQTTSTASSYKGYHPALR